VFRRTRVVHSRLTLAPQPAHEHPPRIQPSITASHPADTHHRATVWAKFGISGHGPQLRPLQPGAPHSSFSTYVLADIAASFSAQAGSGAFDLTVVGGRRMEWLCSEAHAWWPPHGCTGPVQGLYRACTGLVQGLYTARGTSTCSYTPARAGCRCYRAGRCAIEGTAGRTL
jgi:hypothetical protein